MSLFLGFHAPNNINYWERVEIQKCDPFKALAALMRTILIIQTV